jgi:hypothetical protein
MKSIHLAVLVYRKKKSVKSAKSVKPSGSTIPLKINKKRKSYICVP